MLGTQDPSQITMFGTILKKVSAVIMCAVLYMPSAQATHCCFSTRLWWFSIFSPAPHVVGACAGQNVLPSVEDLYLEIKTV